VEDIPQVTDTESEMLVAEFSEKESHFSNEA
jgi:hypothetical protein